ncbi:MAG: 3-deoxy-manno-octulosonate cytidylyltransferase [Phycisphaerales bacterium]
MSDTQAVIIVPARLASTRFPEKVLASATGKPLVQHVAEAAARARCATRVVVAADDERIARALKPYGTAVVMTRVDHPNGSSRLSEACQIIGMSDDAIVVNAQGDEPEMDAGIIDAAVTALLRTPGAVVGTAAAPLRSMTEFRDPNVVKVVTGVDGRALYFSRAPIPLNRDRPEEPGEFGALRHVGVYAYRVGFLRAYVSMPATALERTESLEQLRVLEHGHVIGVARVATAHAGIDTPEQYAAFVERYARGAGGGRGGSPRV